MRFVFIVCCWLIMLSGPVAAQEKQITMKLPDPVTVLPKLPSLRVTVYAPEGLKELTFHDRPVIADWKNKLFVAWTAALRSERSRPTRGFLAASSDRGKTWRKPTEPAKNGDRDYIRYMRKRFNIPGNAEVTVCARPTGFHGTKNSLYFFQQAWIEYSRPDGSLRKHSRGRLFKTSNGLKWVELPPSSLDSNVDGDIREHWMQRRFVKLKNGKILAATLNRKKRAPVTINSSGMTGWAWGEVPVKVGIVDPIAWQGEDGIVHFAAGRSSRLWHSYSTDGGHKWSPLLRQSNFTDNNGGFIFGRLPDGSTFYVGTPLEFSQRCPLIFARSRDGWKFEQLHQIRWEPFYRKYPWAYKGYRPGYEFADAIYCYDRLYVVYALCRDEIELSIVDIRDTMKKERDE